jgi:hypothetical protein
MDSTGVASADFDNYLKVIVSSGERTRAILYFLGLAFAALLAVFVESDVFPWSDIRNDQINRALLCYYQGKHDNEYVPGSKSDTCGPAYKYVEAYSIFEDSSSPNSHDTDATASPNHNSSSPQTSNSAGPKPETWIALIDQYNELTRSHVDSASITLPILGLKIDRGNAFVFAGMALTLLMVTLRLSLLNELKCLYDARRCQMLESTINKIIVINSHVFSRSGNHPYFWWFLFAPLAIVSWDMGINIWDFFKKFYEHPFTASSATTFFVLQIIIFVLLLWASIM